MSNETKFFIKIVFYGYVVRAGCRCILETNFTYDILLLEHATKLFAH